MNFRTDLTLERTELFKEELNGIKKQEFYEEDIKTTVIDILNEETAKKLGKGVGKYITVEINNFNCSFRETEKVATELSKSIKLLLEEGDGVVLVAGVGNSDITADALGPFTASKIFSTRHLSPEIQKDAGLEKALRPVSSISTGVLGQTGIESSEYIKSICGAVKPEAVITVDALATRDIKRLGTTIQLSNTGISPGSGIGNKRKRIDESFIGAPVIAIGVPTVVDALSLIGEENTDKNESGFLSELIVTPKDIDIIIKKSSEIISFAINLALQKDLTFSEIKDLL